MINKFANIIGVSVDDLIGRSRKRSISEARQLYWWMLFQTGMSCQEIAKVSNRDRTTIYPAIKKVDFLLRCEDRILVEMYNKVKKLNHDNSSRF